MVTMTSSPVTDRYMPSRATTALIRDSRPVDGRPATSCSWSATCGSVIPASPCAPRCEGPVSPRGDAGPDAMVLLRVLDTLDEALQLLVTGELVVDRLHRIDEFHLVGDRDDLDAGSFDGLAGGLLTLVPELAHDGHRFL